MNEFSNPQSASFARESARPPAVIHVDLDSAAHIFRTHKWSYDYPDDPLFESGLRNLLAFLAANHCHATLFTVADDLDDPRKRDLIQQACRDGHEIASHSLSHATFAELTREQKRVEIAESRAKLEQNLGTTVTGFRVPSYQVDRDCLELLGDYGYAYDSSAFPTAKFAARLQTPNVAAGPHRPLSTSPLIELPLPDYRPAPFPFSPSYSLLFGTWYFRQGLRRVRRSNEPFILLFHLTDFADPLPSDRLPSFAARIYTLSNIPAAKKIGRCQEMLNIVSEHYDMKKTADLLKTASTASVNGRGPLLAISTTHETGAAVFVDGKLRSAISEERMDRVKFSTQYPPEKSIEESIRVAGIDPRAITDIVISGLPAGKLAPSLLKGQLGDFADFHALNDYFPHFNKVLYRSFYMYRALQYGAVRSFMEKKYGVKPRLHFVEHHLAHASGAYRTAPFEDALIVTADGVGDDISFTISKGQNGRITRLHEVRYPHSFGQFYTACTQVLGFRGGRHEGKITGLSGYGKLDPELYAKVKSTIRSSGPDFKLDKRYYSEGIVRGFSMAKMRKGENLFDVLQYRNYKMPLKRLLEGYPREDVAAVFQTLLEEEVVALVRPFAEQTGLKNLALAGGVFANVKLNHALFRALDMERVYVFPAMGDGGLSVGAAMELLQTPPEPFEAPYWGPDYTEDEMEAALQAGQSEGLRYRRDENIECSIAEHLAQGKVIARFNGRMEFGPRALCNRSILYSATDPEANNWLNKRLRRTEFMPFAPVAMTERASDLFLDMEGKEHALKFMTIIVECTDWTKEHCPAIVHVDGTARPQFVTEEVNPSMYKILQHYEALTGIPLMVNTSFNMHEEPIVCSPADAVRAYLDSRLDYLAVGPFLAWLED